VRSVPGTSLLFVYDTSFSLRVGSDAGAAPTPKLQTGVWMIDFAHCIAHQDCHLTHRSSWQVGVVEVGGEERRREGSVLKRWRECM